MKTAKGWRQLKKEFPKPDLTLDDLYKYLTELFHRTPDNPRRLGRQNIVGYTREDGTEMIRHEGPDVWGGAMPLAEWNKLIEDQMTVFRESTASILLPLAKTGTLVLPEGVDITQEELDEMFLDETKYIAKNKVK